MKATIQRARQKAREEGGFTLVELLIVIIIIGILAGVVVFAVQGITDRGQDNACAADKRAMEAAVEAYYADNNAYPADGGGNTAEQVLEAAGFIRQESDLYNVTTGTGAVTPQGGTCPA
jgi:general secretion pathway protein G